MAPPPSVSVSRSVISRMLCKRGTDSWEESHSSVVKLTGKNDPQCFPFSVSLTPHSLWFGLSKPCGCVCVRACVYLLWGLGGTPGPRGNRGDTAYDGLKGETDTGQQQQHRQVEHMRLQCFNFSFQGSFSFVAQPRAANAPPHPTAAWCCLCKRPKHNYSCLCDRWECDRRTLRLVPGESWQHTGCTSEENPDKSWCKVGLETSGR